MPQLSTKSLRRAALAGASLLGASPLAWSGATTASLHIQMIVLDRCQVRADGAAPAVEARCSSGVVKPVTVAPAAPTAPAPGDTAVVTSQPLPRDTPPGQDLVAIVF